MSDSDEHHRRSIRPRGPSPRSLGALIAGFKWSVTKQIDLLRATPGLALWQRNYHEHIIRDQKDWGRIHRYVGSNPCKWTHDEENPVILSGFECL